MLVLILALVALLVVLFDRTPAVNGPVYTDALAATEAHAAELNVDGPAARDVVFHRFGSLWGDLDGGNIDRIIDRVYAGDVWFNDTVKTVTGLGALREYLHDTADRVDSCRVVIDEVAQSGVNYYVRWRMEVIPHGAKPEQAWTSIGVTHLRFDAEGRVILHQDYWDSASGLYEHLPSVGWIIRNIKARL